MNINRIFPIPEIEDIIVSYLDLLEYFHVFSQLNKAYHTFVINKETYREFRSFYIFVKSYPYRIDNNFSIACHHGFPLVAKYLYQKHKVHIDVLNITYAGKTNQVELCMWLIEQKNPTADIIAMIIYHVCLEAGLNTIVKLLTYYKVPIDHQNIFIGNCLDDRLHVAIYVYEHCKTINIRASGTIYGRHVYAYGLMISYRVESDYAFVNACIQNQFLTLEWLQSIAIQSNVYYTYEIINNKIRSYTITHNHISVTYQIKKNDDSDRIPYIDYSNQKIERSK